MDSSQLPGEEPPTSQERYKTFLRRVVSSEKVWAVWSEDSWLTTLDPMDRERALFFLWPTKASAQESLDSNLAKFPEGAEVDSIELEKWLDLYTPDLIRDGTRPFVYPDGALKGIVVDAVELHRDLRGLMFKSELQGTDLARLHRKHTGRTK